MCGHSSLLFYSHSRPEKMGCCFSKELNPGQQNERSGLLQPPLHDGLSEVTEQVRQHAAAVAQHVCLEEEETCVPDRPAWRKSLEDEERPSEPDNQVWTKTTLASRDSTTCSEGDPKPASTHEEKEAILITTSTNMHINTDTEADVTQAARPSCEPAPYMEVLTQSPVRQKILENATLRALWFNQLPGGQKQHKPANCWSSPAGLPSTNVSGCQETQRESPRAEHRDGESEEACVITTLCQGFERRSQSFYSICSIDADDLQHYHDHSQDKKTAGAAQSPRTAEAETAALLLESVVTSQSHTEASTLHIYTGESKMTCQSHDEEPASPSQSPAAEQSATTVLSQTHTDNLLSAKKTTPLPPVADPLPDVLSPHSSQTSGEEPQYSTADRTQSEAAAQKTDESKHVMSVTSHIDESGHVEEKDRCVKGSEEIMVNEECVCSVDHRAAEGVTSGTVETVVDLQVKDLGECVDSGINPLNSDLHESDHRAEQHMHASSQSLCSSDPGLKVLNNEEKDALPVSVGHTDVDEPPLQSEVFPVSICRSPGDRTPTVPPPIHLTASSASHTSDKLEFSSYKPGRDHSNDMFDNCDKQLDSSDVKTEGEVVSCSDKHFQDVFLSGRNRQEGNNTKPETEEISKDAQGGDVTETGQNTSLLETSDYKCDVLSEHCDNCTHTNTSICVQDLEDPESGIEDSSLSPIAQPRSADPELFSSSPCASIEEGEESFCSETEAFTSLHPQIVSSDCVSPQVDVEDSADCSSSHMEGINVMMSQEEHPAQDGDLPSLTCNTSSTETPNDFCCQHNLTSVLDYKGDHTMITVDPDQVDIYASTPSYEIHFLGHEVASATEEGEREGGMREMVSELLGEDADSSVCRLCPLPWIKLGLEDGCSGWAQGAPETEPGQDKSKAGTNGEQIPESVSELQPSMALLGAYPYSTVMPQGLCVWDWHTDCTQSVSVLLVGQLG